MSEIKYVNGRPMVPSGHPDGTYIPVATPYASEAAEARLKQDRERLAHERAQAAVRARVEAELRAGGCPERDVRRLADEAMTGSHLERAQATARGQARSDEELRDYFRRQARSASAVG